MIKNIKKYLEESERERAFFLKNLSYRESAKILEGILSSAILLKMHFFADDNPVSLDKQSRSGKGWR